MTKRDIEELTDWQIDNLYFKPAVERSNQMRRDAGLPPASTPVEVEEPTPGEPTKRTESEYVRNARAVFGGTEAHWRNEWKRQHPGEK